MRKSVIVLDLTQTWLGACAESSLTNLIGSGFNLLCLQNHSKPECRWTWPMVPIFSAWQKGPVGTRLGFFNIERTVERTQLNAAHAQLLEKLRLIALAESCRFLTIQSLEFWQKNSSETTQMIYHEKSEFWHRAFSILQKTIHGELRKSPKSKFY